MNVVYFKLMNGDDIMANLIDETDDEYVIDYPYRFVFNINPISNVLSTSVVRWVPMKDIMVTPMKIRKSSVITHSTIKEHIEEYYARIRLETQKEFEDEDYYEIEEDDDEINIEDLIPDPENKIIH